MRYRFKRAWRLFKPGDAVPDALGGGIVQTLAARGVVEAIGPAPEEIETDLEIETIKPPVKAIKAPPADKRLRSGRVANK